MISSHFRVFTNHYQEWINLHVKLNPLILLFYSIDIPPETYAEKVGFDSIIQCLYQYTHTSPPYDPNHRTPLYGDNALGFKMHV